MSQRHVSLAELCARSGLARHEVGRFLDALSDRGLLVSRDAPARDLGLLSLRPLRNWLRRGLVAEPAPRLNPLSVPLWRG